MDRRIASNRDPHASMERASPHREVLNDLLPNRADVLSVGCYAVMRDGVPDWSTSHEIQLINVANLHHHPWNPRIFTSAAEMRNLTESVKADGIKSPLVIMPRPDDRAHAYILSGNRRFFAVKEAGLTYIPCQLESRPLSEGDIRRLLILYNEHHLQKQPIDRANSYMRYMKAAGLSMTELAKELSINVTSVGRLLALLKLPPAAQDLVNRGKLAPSSAYWISLSKKGEEFQNELARRAVERQMTGTAVRNAVYDGTVKRSSAKASAHVTPTRVAESTDLRTEVEDIVVTVTSARRKLQGETLGIVMDKAMTKLTAHFEMPSHHGSAEGESFYKTIAAQAAPGQKDTVIAGLFEPEVNDDIKHIEPGHSYNESIGLSSKNYGGAPLWDRPHEIQEIELSRLLRNPFYDRAVTSQSEMILLQESISQDGIRTPLVITRCDDESRAYILSGHRRAICALQLKHTNAPCLLDPIRMTDEELQRSLILYQEHHLQTQPIDRARSYIDYMRSAGITQDELAARLNLEPDKLGKLLSLLSLPPLVQQYINQGLLSDGIAQWLLRVRGGAEEQEAMAKRAISKGWTVADAQRAVLSSTFKISHFTKKAPQGTAVSLALDHPGETGHQAAKVHVELKSSRANVPMEELQQALSRARALWCNEDGLGARQSLDTDPVHAEPPAQHQDLIRISDLWPEKAEIVERLMRKYFAEKIVSSEDGDYLPTELVHALKLRMHNNEFIRAGVPCTKNTQFNVNEWLQRSYDELHPVSALEILTYWDYCAAKLASFRRSEIRLDQILDSNLDVDAHESRQVYATTPAMHEILGRMRAAVSSTQSNLAGISEARSLQSSTEQDDVEARSVILDSEDLLRAGIVLGGRFWGNFSRWIKSNRGEILSSYYLDEGMKISLGEYREYCFYCLGKVIDLTGGKGSRTVGSAQLDSNLVSFSENRSSGTKRLFSGLAIIREYQSNLAIIGDLLEERSRLE
ncbi:MAG: ParB/RepB/Spo0J family partition protein [Deltaproteobacteria bacterium]|nr:ParB/RepB/Spo0J family partition protein [Deltaproteobacteria bacterium]